MKDVVVEALVFDMDGLLFDSERIVKRSWEDAGNQIGIEHMGDHIYHTLGRNLAGRNEYFCQVIDADFPCKEFAERTRVCFYKIVSEEGLPMKPGVRELLEYGKDKGYRMAVASSSRREYATKNLKEAGIYKFFDGTIFGDMVKHAKPDPEIYLRACECIGVKPERSIALEDAPAGIKAAHAAGMLPVMIPDLVEPTKEIESLIYKKCVSLHEVIALLEELRS